MTRPHLTDGLRLALAMAQEMVDSFESSHPWPQWRQALAWRDIERELVRAGFSAEQFQVAHLVWGEERRIEQGNPPSSGGPASGSVPLLRGGNHTEPPVAMRQEHEEDTVQ